MKENGLPSAVLAYAYKADKSRIQGLGGEVHDIGNRDNFRYVSDSRLVIGDGFGFGKEIGMDL